MADEPEKTSVTELPGKHEGFGEGNLWIKLKIGEIEDSSEDNQIQIMKNDYPRVCVVCKKGFRSGKALGGHMRVHVQENKGHSIKMNENSTKCKKKNQNAQYLDSLSEKPTCFLCGKSFPSIKSLFGHMRCHPEREWRGIQPPQARNNSSSSTVSNERAINLVTDLMKSLPGWPVTARRGRRALHAAASSFSSGEDDSLPMSEEEREAVRDLMRLAQGESIDSGLTSKHKFKATNSNSSSTIKAEIEVKNRAFESKKERIEDSPGGNKKMKVNETGSNEAGIGKNIDKGKGMAMFGSGEIAIPEKSVENFSDGEEFGGKNSDESVSSDELIMMKLKMKKNKKKKKLKLRDLEGINHVQRPIVEYKCNTCNKCFPSHQALGGHRSSHNKIRNKQATTDNESFSLSISPAEIEDSPSISRDGKTTETNNEGTPFQPILTHQCKICNKIFPSGQGLGGHKRCHWTGPVEGPSSQATSPGEASRTGRVLGFDLNELPSMEEDDGGVESQNAAGIFGYAYSST